MDSFEDEFDNYAQIDDAYFNKLILYNDQQNSGLLELVKKPLHNLSSYMKYPQYNANSKTVTFSKSDNIYSVNTFWDTLRNAQVRQWSPSDKSLSEFKILNAANYNYLKKTHKKDPLRAKNLRSRYILDNRSDIRITSQFIIIETQTSYK